MQKKSRNELIQMMRGIGALTVYIWHIHNHYLDYVFKGYLANTFFFFLAAFFIGKVIYSKRDAIADFNTFAFLKKRLKKIYPLYMLTTIAMAAYAIVGGGQLEDLFLKKLIPHLLLIRSWIPCYPYDTGGIDAVGLNGPGWFLSAMFLYWILTKPMLKLVRYISQQKKRWNVLFVVSWCLIILVFGLFVSDIDAVPNAFRPQHILVYLLGLYAGYNFCGFRKIENKAWNALMIIAWTAVVLIVSNVTLISDAFSQVAGDTLFALELMYLIPVTIKKSGFECKNIVFKHLKMLGDISFEFYLIHIPMLTFLMAINYHLLSNPMRGFIVYAIGYVATFLVAWLYKTIAGKVQMKMKHA